jgi:hypothetical protein
MEKPPAAVRTARNGRFSVVRAWTFKRRPVSDAGFFSYRSADAPAQRFEARLESNSRRRGKLILSGILDAYALDSIRVAACKGWDAVDVCVFDGSGGGSQAACDARSRVEGRPAELGRRGVRVTVRSA